ncbi:MAG: FAD-dependent oxidoreductase [Xanthomonadales bacterium]|nr:FAD-dependent oxidoreductase [Xanthomonadales bacterium]NIN58404.1 FAD-dependent oxidoreductase [Xanthomonadales bacterium]NIN73741.1 FAD-dependent oxidoreductase [Xanthomonadales bacterium]NIO14539.1 FAD-dependent oxidoreductase [Xanthomonadales bacterium]NIP10797.1 FAD-dependent oxidoreductase [Xanthomonadales bacterium]
MSGQAGAWVRPERGLTFRFEGRDIPALEGDTIASALAANGQYLLSRSFKYHRPRGPLSLAGHEANCLVQLPGAANVCADQRAVESGMRVRAQNTLGTLRWDLGAVLQWFSRWLPVGFYYRAFYWPRGAWDKWFPWFRRAAGLGKIDPHAPPRERVQQHLFCDVLVIGAGVAGLHAARLAADEGREVILVDRNSKLGGAMTYRRPGDGGVADEGFARLLATVREHARIRCLTDATANGWFEDHWVPVIQGESLFRVRAKAVCVCTGVIEQPAIFRNNDLPGILLGSGAQRLIRRYAVRPGRSAVVLAGNDAAYEVALDLIDAGVALRCLVEMRPEMPAHAAARALIEAGVQVECGATVYEARAARRGGHLRAVDIRAIDAPGVAGGRRGICRCDLLVVSVGYMPAYQLPCQAGGRLSYLDHRAVFRIEQLPAGMHVAGAINGCMTPAQAMTDAARAIGEILGAQAAPAPESPGRWCGPSGESVNYPLPIFPHPRGREFVDFDEDLQIADIVRSVREGYRDIQLAKRFSACGMGPSQGRHSALAMARIVASETGQTVAATGVTTARPPVGPETIGHYAGPALFPRRRAPMHDWHRAAGAQWMVADSWRRPAFYGAPERSQHHIAEEVRAVRQRAGIIDVSTLGGIDVVGPDAGEFLDRIYTGRLSALAVNRSRYALMTNDAGAVIDDGVACRLAADQFYVTTTTSAAERVYRILLWWQAQWRLQVDILNAGPAWAAFNVAGPAAREILQGAGFGDEIGSEALPFLAAREVSFAGCRARLIRTGFVGELGFEIHLPFHAAQSAWERLVEVGKPLGLQPFGVEAQRILRLEKGHVIVGQDTDAMSSPMEIGMDWAIGWKKPYFVGKRSLQILAGKGLSRCLAGFRMPLPRRDPPRESHLVIHAGRVVGRVTSSGHSPTLEAMIGLAQVPPDLGQPGRNIDIRCAGGRVRQAQIVPLPFYDPDNERQRC